MAFWKFVRNNRAFKKKSRFLAGIIIDKFDSSVKISKPKFYNVKKDSNKEGMARVFAVSLPQ